MATRVESTVVWGGAGDYTSLSAWEAGEVGDLIQREEIAVAICSNGTTTGESNIITIDGWTTDKDHWIEIRALEAQWHPGAYTTGAYFRIAPSSAGNVFAVHANNVRLIHVQMSKGSQAADTATVHFKAAESGQPADWRVEGCLMWRNAGNWASGAGITLADDNYGVKVQNTGVSNGRLVVQNCCVYNYNHYLTAGDITPNGGICCDDPDVTLYAFHNTLIDCGRGLVRLNGTMIAINNLISCGADTPAQVAAYGTFAAGTDYNATNNDSMGYTVTGSGNTHDRVSQTFTFTTTPTNGNNTGVNQNLKITVADAGARNFGRHLGEYLDHPTNLDLMYLIRPAAATPDIGWNEVEGVAGVGMVARIDATTETTGLADLTFLLTSAKMAFGEQSPGAGYIAAPWSEWSNGAGGAPSISGDASWGKLLLESGQIAHSPVYDSGSTDQKNLILTMNQFGTGNSSFTLYTRGSATPFAQDDASPAWQQYTAPAQVNWRYLQVRVVGA